MENIGSIVMPFFDTDDEQNDFCCPVCLKVLFLTEEDAIKALKE